MAFLLEWKIRRPIVPPSDEQLAHLIQSFPMHTAARRIQVAGAKNEKVKS
jgi:hypothetical protein